MSTLLAGDVGGTKTLLALYTVEGGRLIRGRSERFASADWQDFAALQDRLVEEAFENLLDNIFNKAFSNW